MNNYKWADLDKWDRRFLGLAEHIAGWSKDPSTKAGCVIVDRANRIVSLGFNGLPARIADTEERLSNRELKYRLTLHAEQNALLFARVGLVGCTCYTWPLAPCAHCSVSLVQSGIARVVAPVATGSLGARWGADILLASDVLAEAGVDLMLVSEVGVK